MAATPGWTTVPASGDSGWELYRPPAAPHHAAATPSHASPAPLPAVSTPPQRAAPVQQAGARHRRHARTPTPTSIVVKPEPAGAVVAVTRPATTPGYASAPVLAALVIAIACLASASAPTSQLRRWRGALFVADNRVGITSTGAACLLVAAILFVLTRA